jgi:TolB-like protein
MGYARWLASGAILAGLSAGLSAPAVAQRGEVAQRKELVAVLDLGILGGTQAQGAALTNQLRAELLRTGRVTLVDRSQLEAILDEQALQQSGCTSTECAVDVGKILGIRQIVTGTLTKLDENLWQVSIQLIDVETTETIKAEVFTHEGNYVSLLSQGMTRVAKALTSGVKIPEAPVVEADDGKPGWALWTGVGVITAGLGFGVRAQQIADEAHSEADSARENNDTGDYRLAERGMDAAKLTADVANGLFLIGGGLLLYYWLSGDEPETASARGADPGIAALPLNLQVTPREVRVGWVMRW